MKLAVLMFASLLLLQAMQAHASQGDGSAAYVTGLAAYQRGDYATALKSFSAAAFKGNPKAEAYLGGMYVMGQGVPKNFDLGVSWATESAQQDDPLGQMLMGILYSAGWGVAKDQMAAVRWYRLAAAQGLPQAQLLLGVAYAKGDGVHKDLSIAKQWIQAAAEHGNSPDGRAVAVLAESELKTLQTAQQISGQPPTLAANSVGSEQCSLAMLRQVDNQGGALSDDDTRFVNAYLQAHGMNRLLLMLADDTSDTMIAILGKTCRRGMTLQQALDALSEQVQSAVPSK